MFPKGRAHILYSLFTSYLWKAYISLSSVQFLIPVIILLIHSQLGEIQVFLNSFQLLYNHWMREQHYLPGNTQDFLFFKSLLHCYFPLPPPILLGIGCCICGGFSSVISDMKLQYRIPRLNPWVRKIPWRRKWHPTPVLLPGKFHGWRSLVGYSPWGHRESDMTEQKKKKKSCLFPGR